MSLKGGVNYIVVYTSSLAHKAHDPSAYCIHVHVFEYYSLEDSILIYSAKLSTDIATWQPSLRHQTNTESEIYFQERTMACSTESFSSM